MKRLLTALAVICGFLACEKVPEEIPVASVSLSQSTAEMVVGETVSLIATVLPSNATDKTVIWASSNQSVATVSGGKVTAVAEGTSTITASSGGKSATCLVTVRKQTIDVSSVELSKTELALTEGDTETLVATVKPDDATDKTVTWSSSNQSIATVDGGVVTAVAEGAATITAAAGGKTAICTVTVSRKQEQYLTFRSEGTTTISMTNKGANAPVVYYSYDKSNWTRWNYGELTFTKESPLFLYGDNPKGFSTTYDDYSMFCSSGANFSATGNIMRLLDQSEDNVTIPSECCFYYLFYNCANLTSAPDLPATTMTHRCYSGMFSGCTSLTQAPELPATHLRIYCYREMFSGCTSLKKAPVLPATSVEKAPGCYWDMFSGCTSLTQAPALLATVMSSTCYRSMFSGCTSLTAAPVLPATTLKEFCYRMMFSGCTSITTAPELPATIMEPWCYEMMFCGCSSLKQAPELPATSLAERCYSFMFSSCSSLTQAPKLPVTILEPWCYESMFSFCTSLTQAPELPAMSLAKGCYLYMFSNCTSLTQAPELPATLLAEGCYKAMFSECMSLTQAPELRAVTLVKDCYVMMFQSCKNLNYIKALFTTEPSDFYTERWVVFVSKTGTFVKSSDATWDVTGHNGVPKGWTVETASN